MASSSKRFPDMKKFANAGGKRDSSLPDNGCIYPNMFEAQTETQLSIRAWSRNIFDYGPDLVFGWVLLFVLLSTTTNAVSILAKTTSEQSDSFRHTTYGTRIWPPNIWVRQLMVIFFLTASSFLSRPSPNGWKKDKWFVPAVANGSVALTPFDSSDMSGFFWHIFILPVIILGSTSKA